ncbi:DUF6953 family protein [Arthrobacter sp. G.S.26]|uniref:DUF6953 family protein n=1 Tax=Arthrobacter sp. G.S.26 TaxID=3433706 RepID=UPI003D7799B8
MTETSGTATVDAAAIARWLIRQIEDAAPGHAHQGQLVAKIRKEFGAEWSYRNPNGNWAISKEVLKEFAEMKYPTLQWHRGSQSWQVVSADQLERILARQEQSRTRQRARAEAKAARLQ